MLSALFDLLDKYFPGMDKQAVTILMGVAVAHQLPGEMVWLRLYGASRSGKTEILRAIAAHSVQDRRKRIYYGIRSLPSKITG